MRRKRWPTKIVDSSSVFALFFPCTIHSLVLYLSSRCMAGTDVKPDNPDESFPSDVVFPMQVGMPFILSQISHSKVLAAIVLRPIE